tara:strand:- start:435 stop:560 length:126 start_codon:yes stop_codon:yes gene_type:complete
MALSDDFIKTLAKYYQEFLSSDFKKARNFKSSTKCSECYEK